MIECVSVKDITRKLAKGNLKPCPFCGSENIREHSGYPMQYWVVKCRDCGGKMQRHGSREQAIAAWNRRPGND